MTTSRSKAVTKVKIFKCRGSANPKSKASSVLKNNNIAKNKKVDPSNVINDVETIFPLSFSLEKNLKKAVSMPNVKNAMK